MTDTFTLPRKLVVFAVVLPLAAVVGYLLATPDQLSSLSAIGLVLTALSLPLLLHFHYPMLLFSWNASMTVLFLPGKPGLWMLMTALTLLVVIMSYGLNRQMGFLNVPSVTWPLIFLTAVILGTAKLTGGIGLRVLGGGTYGGKKYLLALGAIAGYFAISCLRIAPDKAHRYTALYFLSGLTSALSNLIYMAGPAFWILFLVFSPDYAYSQALEDFQKTSAETKFSRLGGIAVASIPVYCYLLLRYGIRGIMDVRKPWRLLALLGTVGIGTLGGFRSVMLVFGLTFAVQFCLERLYRTWLLPGLALAVLAGTAVLVPLTPRLPLSVQRSLSILPLPIHAAVRQDAQGSIDWRVEMWEIMYSQVPKYFWVGKGYAVDPADLYLTHMAVRQGLAKAYESALAAGDYHSGPLSLLIPFGIFGVVGFVWFLGAGARLLWRNYRYGAGLKNVNTLLLAYFLARVIFYFIGFGAFNTDLALFVGLIGLSVALNSGMREAATSEEPTLAPAAAAVPA